MTTPTSTDALPAAIARRLDAGIARRLDAGIARRLGIDTRALAAFRVGAGILLLVDLLLRARDLTAFYTDRGVLPRVVLDEVFPVLSHASIHAISGEAWFQAACFAVAGIAALALTVGYRTRLSATASWVLLASLQVRNYYVLNAGDTILLVVLFVGLFLPLGRRWSVDAVVTGASTRRVVGFATAAMLSQIVLLYATNAVFKLRGDLWPRGVAVRYVFELERFTVLLGEYLADMPVVLEGVNWLWLALLVASPLLLAATPWLRTGLVGAFVAGHVGMALTMGLGLFPLVVVVCLLVFLPSPVWDRVDAQLRPHGDRIASRVASSLSDTDRTGPSIPVPVRRAVDRAMPVVTGTILVVGLLWHAAAVGVVPSPDTGGGELDADGWRLFAPSPPRAQVWYVVTGRLESGRSVDLYPHANTSRTPPPDVGDTYPNRRWRKYLTRLRQHPALLGPSFASYLCSSGADRYDEPVQRLSVEYVRAPVVLDGRSERRVVGIGTYTCPVREERRR